MAVLTISSPLIAVLMLWVPAAAQSASDQPQDTDRQAEGASVEHGAVTLRALDKVTARISEFAVPIGETRQFGSLTIRPHYCRTRPPIEPPETFAYLEIEQARPSGGTEAVFAGWMLASNPAINPLEHPVYDIWVIRCSTVAPSASDPSL